MTALTTDGYITLAVVAMVLAGLALTRWAADVIVMAGLVVLVVLNVMTPVLAKPSSA